MFFYAQALDKTGKRQFDKTEDSYIILAMKKPAFISISFAVLLIVSFAYTLCFPVQLITRPVYKADSVISTESDMEITYPDAYFVEDDIIAYFSIKNESVTFIEDLSILNDEYEKNYIAGNINGYVKYNKSGTLLQFFSPNGALLSEQRSSGCYPYIIDDSPVVYAIKDGGQTLRSFYFNGEPLLQDYIDNSLICSVSMSENFDTAISYADGDSLLLNKSGEVIFSCEQKESEIKIAKASCYSADSKFFCEISGLFPEILTIYNVDTKAKIAQFKTGSNFRYAPLMKIYNDVVYYETENALELYFINNGEKSSLQFNGELIDFKVNTQNEIILLSEKDSMNYLYIYNSEGVRSFYQESYNSISNLRVYDSETFYFKFDKEIYVLRRKMLS